MFKNKCYIQLPKDDKDLIKSIKTLLNRFDYKKVETIINGIQDEFVYIVCNSYENGEYYITNVNPEINKELIYCGSSKSLFLFISAVNDKNDKYQLFTDDIRFEMCPEMSANICSWESMYKTTPHKANNFEIFDYCYQKQFLKHIENHKTLHTMIIGNEEIDKNNYFAYLNYASRYGWKLHNDFKPFYDDDGKFLWSNKDGKFFYTDEEFKNLLSIINNNLIEHYNKFSK